MKLCACHIHIEIVYFNKENRLKKPYKKCSKCVSYTPVFQRMLCFQPIAALSDRNAGWTRNHGERERKKARRAYVSPFSYTRVSETLLPLFPTKYYRPLFITQKSCLSEFQSLPIISFTSKASPIISERLIHTLYIPSKISIRYTCWK